MGAVAKHKHPWIRRIVGAGVLVGAGYALWRAIEANRSEHDLGWETQPFPYPPRPRTVEAHEPSTNGWVEPNSATCPASHPVKGKLSSGIYHVPGGFSYDRTNPDRCYVDATAAEADGLRPAKR